MSWLVFALSGPILWAISTHLDKYLVERYFKDTGVGVLLVFTALIGLASLPVIALLQPDVIDLPPGAIAVVAASGVLYLGAMYFYLQALQREEASVVAPWFQAAPLMGYLVGYFILGETLSHRQMLGGAMIVAGAVLVSMQPGKGLQFRARLVTRMLLCALALTASSTVFKVFAVEDAFWPTTFWSFVGQAAFGFALLLMPGNRREFVAIMRRNTGALLAINGSNEIINLGGGLAARYALVLAPLSLVQAITSTTTLFVFLFGIALSLCCPGIGREDLSRRNLVLKGISTALIVAGLIAMNA
ncbi:MAG TPA: DMT family transporter [Alphaproteobacteria bacterium]|jgi:drug/metabolite transporter (DMT)-like permease|nr:DMT family transporter [Alphaproteobacteria bacterium]